MRIRTLKVAFALLVAFLLAGAPALEAGNKNVRNSSRSSVSNKSANRNTNVNRNSNVNVNKNRNTNVNIDRDRDIDIDVDVDHRHGCCYHDHHHGVGVVGAVAAVAVTAAVIGSTVTVLPPACTVVYANGIAYQQCGGAYYQPRYVGTSVSYVVVASPF